MGDIEIANANRTHAYLNNVGLGIPATFSFCGCDSIDDGPYASPLSDPAPWYDVNRQESAEFFGLLAHDVRVDSVAVRSVTPRASVGSSIGRRYLRHRILAVQGLMLARSDQGQAYGEAWLRDVLSGNRLGCAPDSVRVLLSCPSGGAIAQFRTLRRCGIVDGPNFGPVNEIPECHIQSVQFQIAAGVPWLMSDEIVCLAETTLTGGS